MTWYAVYDAVGGRLRSLTTTEPNPVALAPRGLAAKALTKGLDGTVQWKETLADWEARPAPTVIDRVMQDLVNDPVLAVVWNRLTSAQDTILQDRLVALLGPHRYRKPNESVNLAG